MKKETAMEAEMQLRMALLALVFLVNPTCAQETAKAPFKLEPQERFMVICSSQAEAERYTRTVLGGITLNQEDVSTQKTGLARKSGACEYVGAKYLKRKVVSRMLLSNNLGLYLITQVEIFSAMELRTAKWTRLPRPLIGYWVYFEPGLVF